MKRSEAAQYARWSAATAALLATLTVGVYLRHRWVAHVERNNAPPPAAVNVERESNGLTFSKVDGNTTVFTVEASKSTEFKNKDSSLLQEVKITIFGKSSERHDVIHTQSCQYSKKDGGTICNGEVQMDLQSAADAQRSAKDPKLAPQTVHVITTGIVFDRASGIARTNEKVEFKFPGGSGSAMGTEYNTEEGTLQLLRMVRLTFQQLPGEDAKPPAKKVVVSEDVNVSGEKLEFGRDNRTLHLSGPAWAQTKTEMLTAGEFIFLLDEQFHPQKFRATRNPFLKWNENAKKSSMSLSADEISADIAPEGWLKNLMATGKVHALESGTDESGDMTADSASVELWPHNNQPKEVLLRGKVLLKTDSRKAAENRTLRTEALRIAFSEVNGDAASTVKTAETLEPGSVEWVQLDAKGAVASQTNLQARQLRMEFGPLGSAKDLIAIGDVQTQRTLVGHPMQSTASESGSAQLVAGGGWSQIDLAGDVSLKEVDRSAHAEHATFRRAEQSAVLTGKAVVRDTTTETRAPTITFAQNSGEIRAEGGVRSTDFSPKGGALQLAPVPANITANTMQANSKSGRALYSGNARMWQGESVLEADSIELLKDSRIMNANGNVRGVFAQTAAQPKAQGSVVKTSSRKQSLWYVNAGTLSYRDAENHAHLEKDVVAQSADQRMRAPVVDLFFVRGGPSPEQPRGTSNSPNGGAAGKQISRAVGTGGVTVEEGTRKAVADRGEYSAADGKFIMTGGTPTIFDGAEGTTTGRQLTFFLADDTIIVDSENGSRMLTKHRVEK